MRPPRQEEVVPVPVPVGTVARALEGHHDYRVLRRVTPLRRDDNRHRVGELTVCVLDVETTGLDHRTDRVIELAVRSVVVDQHGAIVEVGKGFSWLEDPGFPLTREITAVTGLTDDDVRDRGIAEGEAFSLIASADLVVSHNAGFDRPFVERRLGLEGQAWACSVNDVDWRAHGFEGRSQSQLLWQCGWFYDAHRAAVDVDALIRLLDHRLPDGQTVIKTMLATAVRPTWGIDLPDTPFSAGPKLKARGYRWDPLRKSWGIVVGDDAIEAETSWAGDHVYGGARMPTPRRITWRQRYAAR